MAMAAAGWPSTAAPAPRATGWPFFSSTMPQVRRSTRSGRCAWPPTTKRAAEVLSATTLFRSNLKSR